MTMGRPPKDRKKLGQITCPICGKVVDVWETWHGTAYSNHDGHGVKFSKRQIEEFFNKNKAPEQTEAPEVPEDEPELQRNGISIFNMEF